jgi:hypothetical protein
MPENTLPLPVALPSPGVLPGAEEDGTPISRIVAQVAASFPGERIALGDMADAFGERAFGLLVLLLCLPSMVPGMASVFGLPMLLFGIQMGLGRRKPYLPGWLARRSVRRDDLLRLSAISSGPLKRIERYLRPRPGWFTSPAGEKLVGWLTAYSAVMLILPGPGTNGPPAFGTIIMALGVVEQDSKVTGWGVGLTIAGCLFATGVLVAICLFGVAALTWIF